MRRLLLVIFLLLTSICEKAHSEEAWDRFFVDFPYKVPSSLRMLDFLNLRLTWLEGDISALSRLTDMTFPDSHIADAPCDGSQRFSLINQELYQEYLLRRLACLEWQLKSVQALLDNPEAVQGLPEKHVQRLSYLREQSHAFSPALQNTRHHLNMVFYSMEVQFMTKTFFQISYDDKDIELLPVEGDNSDAISTFSHLITLLMGTHAEDWIFDKYLQIKLGNFYFRISYEDLYHTEDLYYSLLQVFKGELGSFPVSSYSQGASWEWTIVSDEKTVKLQVNWHDVVPTNLEGEHFEGKSYIQLSKTAFLEEWLPFMQYFSRQLQRVNEKYNNPPADPFRASQSHTIYVHEIARYTLSQIRETFGPRDTSLESVLSPDDDREQNQGYVVEHIESTYKVRVPNKVEQASKIQEEIAEHREGIGLYYDKSVLELLESVEKRLEAIKSEVEWLYWDTQSLFPNVSDFQVIDFWPAQVFRMEQQSETPPFPDAFDYLSQNDVPKSWTDTQSDRLVDEVEVLRQKVAWVEDVYRSNQNLPLPEEVEELKAFFNEVDIEHGIYNYYHRPATWKRNKKMNSEPCPPQEIKLFNAVTREDDSILLRGRTHYVPPDCLGEAIKIQNLVPDFAGYLQVKNFTVTGTHQAFEIHITAFNHIEQYIEESLQRNPYFTIPVKIKDLQLGIESEALNLKQKYETEVEIETFVGKGHNE